MSHCSGELQPWLTQLRDRIEDEGGQCLLISHHPELINYLAAKHGLLLYRDETGPARSKAFEWTDDDVISPAELVAGVGVAMAKKKGVRVQIVVEDEALERFSRETLLKFGFSRHELRVTPYPVGRGSAKDWVRQAVSNRGPSPASKAYQDLGIVVGTDADELTNNQRVNRLATALQMQVSTSRTAAKRSCSGYRNGTSKPGCFISQAISETKSTTTNMT